MLFASLQEEFPLLPISTLKESLILLSSDNSAEEKLIIKKDLQDRHDKEVQKEEERKQKEIAEKKARLAQIEAEKAEKARKDKEEKVRKIHQKLRLVSDHTAAVLPLPKLAFIILFIFS